MSLKALLTLGAERHKEWRRRLFDPPDVALYGTQKVAKTKLTEVLDMNVLELYNRLVALLLRVVALCIVYPKPKRAADTVRVPSGRLPPDGTGSGSSMGRFR